MALYKSRALLSFTFNSSWYLHITLYQLLVRLLPIARHREYLNIGPKTKKVWQVYHLPSCCLWPGLRIIEAFITVSEIQLGILLSGSHIPIFPGPFLQRCVIHHYWVTYSSNNTYCDHTTNLQTYCFPCQNLIYSASSCHPGYPPSTRNLPFHQLPFPDPLPQGPLPCLTLHMFLWIFLEFSAANLC